MNAQYQAYPANGTIDQFLVQQLPQQLPQLSSVPQSIGNGAYQIAQMLINDIQTNRGGSNVRAYFFNMMSDGFYNNQNFGQLWQFTVDLIDFYARNGMQGQQAIGAGIDKALQIYLAAKALGNMQALQGYLTQQMIHDFQVLVNEGQQLAAQIKNAQMGHQVPMGGHYQHQAPVNSAVMAGVNVGAIGMTGGGNNFPSVGGTPVNSGRPSRLSDNQPVSTPAAFTQPMQMDQPTQRPPGRYDMSGVNANGAQPVSSIVNVPPSQVGSVTSTTVNAVNPLPVQTKPAGGSSGRTVYGRGDDTVVQQPTVEQQPAQVGALPMQEAEEDLQIEFGNQERMFDLIVTPNGQHIAPAHLVDWKFTGSKDQPYRLAYDPTETMLVLVKHPATDYSAEMVTESLIPWNVNMEYLRHELDAKLAQKERDRLEVLRTDKPIHRWSVAEALTPTSASMSVQPEEFEPDAGIPEMGLGDIPVFDPEEGEVKVVATLSQGIKTAQDIMRLTGRSGFQREGVELYFDIPTLLILPNEDWVIEVKKLAEMETFDELHHQLSHLTHMDDEESLQQIDQRITKMLLGALRDGMGLRWTFDSFLTDWPDLRETLIKKAGDTDEYLNALNDVAMQLIQATFYRMSTEEADAYVNANTPNLDLTPEPEAQEQEGELPTTEVKADDVAVAETTVEGDELTELTSAEPVSVEVVEDEGLSYDNVVVLLERVSVTVFPMSRFDMLLNLETGPLVHSEYQPNLHRAMQSILQRTAEHKVAYAHRYLMSNDGKFIELRNGILNTDAILLFDRDSVE